MELAGDKEGIGLFCEFQFSWAFWHTRSYLRTMPCGSPMSSKCAWCYSCAWLRFGLQPKHNNGNIILVGGRRLGVPPPFLHVGRRVYFSGVAEQQRMPCCRQILYSVTKRKFAAGHLFVCSPFPVVWRRRDSTVDVLMLCGFRVRWNCEHENVSARQIHHKE